MYKINLKYLIQCKDRRKYEYRTNILFQNRENMLEINHKLSRSE